MVIGCDVSAYQNQIDFAAVKQSGVIHFLYAKCTEGVHEVDEQYKRNRDVARNRGIPIGAYHFFHPGEDPIAQADHFLSVAANPWATLIPMVDVEVTDGCSASEIVASLARFLGRVDARLPIGKRTLIYTGYSFWNDSVNGSDGFSGHPLWIAAYPDSYDPSMTAPVPHGWKSATIWQYSSSGRVPGIAGNVDMDRLNGDLSLIRL